MPKSKAKNRKRAAAVAGAAHDSAAASKPDNLWRRYRLTYVTVAWQERYAGKWYGYSKQITHEDFLKHYQQVPPNAEVSEVAGRKEKDESKSAD